MLDNIVNLIKDKIGGKLQEETGLEAGQIGEAIKLSATSAWQTLKGEATSGNVAGITGIFKGEGSEIIEKIKEAVNGSLVDEMGMSEDIADKFSTSAIPEIIGGMKEKLLGDDGKFDVSDVMRILKEDGGGLLGKITGLFGG